MSTLLDLPLIGATGPVRVHPAAPTLLDRYRTSFLRKVSDHVDRRLQTLRSLRSLERLDPATRASLRVGMRRLECQLAAIVVKKRDSMTTLLRVSVALLAVYYALFIPYWVGRESDAQAQGHPYMLSVAVLLAGAGTLTLLARRGIRRWGDSVDLRRVTGSVAAFFYAGWFFAVTRVDGEQVTLAALQSLGRMLLYGLGLMLLGALAVWWGMWISDGWWDRLACTRHPDAVVADELLGILETVENSPAEWQHLRGRNRVLRALERTARCLESSLPARLRGRDPATEHWLRERAAGQAAAVRGLKRWVLLPRPDTREHFVERIAQDLVRTVVGDWDGLQCLQVDAVPPSRAHRAARMLAPMAVVGACVALALDPTGQVKGLLGALAPFAPVLAPVVGPMLIYAIMRVVNPEMLADLPVVQQIGGAFFPKRA